MVAVVLQARVVDPLHLGVLLKEARQGQRVGAVPLHAHGQGLQAHVDQPGVEGRRRATHVLDHLVGPVLDRVVRRGHDPAHHHPVPAEVLGRGVHHDIGAQLQRALEVRGGEGAVHDHLDLGVDPLDQLGQRCDVGDRQQRVGGRLEQDALGARVGLDHALHRVQVRGVHLHHVDPQASEDRLRQVLGGPVDHVAHDQRVTRAAQGHHGGADGRHAGGEGQRGDPDVGVGQFDLLALQGVELGLQQQHRRVAQAGVDVARPLTREDLSPLGGAVKDKRRGLVDRAGVGGVLGLPHVLSGVERARGEATLEVELFTVFG